LVLRLALHQRRVDVEDHRGAHVGHARAAQLHHYDRDRHASTRRPLRVRETGEVVGADPQGTVAHKTHDPERPETVKGAPLIVIDPLEDITREVDPVRDRQLPLRLEGPNAPGRGVGRGRRGCRR
ncbi:MAG TPA: hypothetical protein VFI46_18380, partial [Jiangellaceae bacterium]|nr:hypothetical protein [Jiangellaceae bacterium]